MVNLQEVHQICRGISSQGPGLVGVFSGATAGIGEGTLKAFAKYAQQPVIYLLGRNKTSASRIEQQVSQLNASAQFHFVPVQLSSLGEIDAACRKIKEQLQRVDLVCLSQGGPSLEGRQETAEGVDGKTVVQYYGRNRIVDQLMPLLEAGPSPHIVTVLAAGREGKIKEDDYELKQPGNYGLLAGMGHYVAMTSLTAREFAKRHPKISFIHLYPGLVATDNLNRFSQNWLIQFILTKVIMTIARPFAYTTEECGERILYDCFSGKYGPGKGHMVGGDCEPITSSEALLDEYEAKGVQTSVMKHNREVWDRVEALQA